METFGMCLIVFVIGFLCGFVHDVNKYANQLEPVPVKVKD